MVEEGPEEYSGTVCRFYSKICPEHMCVAGSKVGLFKHAITIIIYLLFRLKVKDYNATGNFTMRRGTLKIMTEL